MLEPAATVISICGGVDATAALVERDPSRVRRWGYPTERGGTGGFIPSQLQQRLLDAAGKKGLPLEPKHFFKDQPNCSDPNDPVSDGEENKITNDAAPRNKVSEDAA